MALPAYDNPKAGPPSPALSADDLSLSDMSLLTSPAGKPIPRSHQKSGSAERTSLVPITRSSGRNHVSSNDQSGCKLLQGIRTSSVGISGRSATAKNKSKTVQTRRFSLFPPSAVSEETRPVEAEEDDVTDASVLVTDEELRKLGLGLNASHLSGDTLDQRREPFEEQRGERSRQSSSQLSGTATRRLEPDLNPSGESREQKERQVEELAKMNSTFEAYERMLQGSAGQIEASTGCELHSSRDEADRQSCLHPLPLSVILSSTLVHLRATFFLHGPALTGVRSSFALALSFVARPDLRSRTSCRGTGKAEGAIGAGAKKKRPRGGE